MKAEEAYFQIGYYPVRELTMSIFFEIICYFTILTATIAITCNVIGVKETSYKYQSLDGLRGVCAALVAIFHTYWRAGNESDTYWSIDYLDSSTLKSAMILVGEIPVGVFFILSGFLFFKKALKHHNFSTKDFCISRILRIYPPVLASLLIIYLATFLMSDGNVITPFICFINAIPFISEYHESILVNGLPIYITNSGVFWTLVWEFRLYITIPFLCLLMKHLVHKKTAVVISIIFVLAMKEVHIMDGRNAAFIMFFLVGFLVATTEDKIIKNSDAWCFPLILIALVFIRYSYNTSTALYLLPAFYLIKNGTTLSGFLISKPIRVLGTCSFSVYLFHGITQAASKHYLYNINHYIWVFVSLIATGILSPVMYKLIEKPFIEFYSRKVYSSNKAG